MEPAETPRSGRHPAIVSRRQLLLIVGLAAVGLLAISFGRMLYARYELGQRAQALQAEIESLRAEHGELQEELAYWRSDEGLERLAREQLGWVGQGESAVVLTGPDERPPLPASRHAPAPDRGRGPNWRRWWEAFFGG